MQTVLAAMLCLSAAVPTDGLLAWFDAADASSLQGGRGHVLMWTSKVQPLFLASAYGEKFPAYRARLDSGLRPAIYFDGLSNVFRVPRFNQHIKTFTLIAVVAPYSPCRGGAICSASPDAGHDYDPGFTVDLYQSAESFDQISVEGAGRIGGQQDQMSSSFPCGAFHVVSVVRDETLISLYIDGHLEGTRPVSPATTQMDVLRIGARFYAGQERNYFHGEMASLLLYGRALTDAEREEVEAEYQVSDAERAAGIAAFQQHVVDQRRDRMKAPEVVIYWHSLFEYTFIAGRFPQLDPESLPIRKDIREAMALSVQHMNSLFDRDRDDEPYFFVNREADGTGKMRHSVNIGIPHVVGRCLLACMMAEETAGIPFPEDGLAIFERYCRQSFDNPDHLNSYYDPDHENKRFVEFHNTREGLYGLWALIKGRDSAWARETAHAMLATLDSITDDQGRWIIDREAHPDRAERWLGVATPNAGRTVDPLLALYDATGDPLAMDLAGKYARQSLATMFTNEGRFAPMAQSSGHVHSITSTLSGIAAYAARTNDEAMLAACRRIVDAGAPEYFSSWGWGDEVYPEHPADVISRGEVNQTGDVVRTAIILGEAGWPDYYDLAERYLRSMILPTQHREAELRAILKDKENPADDSERDTVRRSIGGYAMQLPNDRMRAGDWPISTLDITSGAVHAMSECYRHRTVRKENGYRVNLLFDFEDDGLVLTSGLPIEGKLAFTTKKAIPSLRMRIPPWVDRASVKLVVNGESKPLELDGVYALVADLSEGASGELTFDVPCKLELETVDGIEYETLWFGNQVVLIKPRGAESPLPF